ncbi:hypothetical protein PLESTB_000816900 [Pleodorina starrii]|uniref:Transglutaminase-like domain-containing protein n=1 Tax=Pleodorina starrii TaxID=330485 RepID=A0A9W6BM20_9CHLO|nr:hypothetical protein PLESTM_000132700 [Pleodorina starrii]GLC54037.1 hypothetical protein PLESTB_000816900 [Pleodorina starrii]
MDPDEALARMLQEEELRTVQAMQAQMRLQQQQQGGGGRGGGGGGGDTAGFRSRLEAMLDTALRCEDPGLQEQARAVMPLTRLRAAAEEAAGLAARLGPDVEAPSVEDLLARGLLHWFKTGFFTWVDTLPCSRCGSRATGHGGSAAPLPEDLAAGAHRVELHACRACGALSRFPRYNDPGKLLQPGCRRGRCGEWANAFLLCCRAAGLTARYVSDWADHVWTEYYSHSMRRWVHLDSCEASYDQPLLYEAGWGKQVSYVVAAGVAGVVDVTSRYTARPWRREVLPRRTLVSERWLGRQLDDMTSKLRAGPGWSAPRQLLWLGRDAAERMELLRQRLGVRPAGRSVAAQQPLPGRQTGSLEWRQQRGETGASGSSSVAPEAAAAPAAARAPTSYRPAPDEPELLPPVFSAAGRLSGGACRAAGHNETVEVVERLFDGRVDTKWLDFGGAGPSGSSWVEYRMPTDRQAVVLYGYELVSANDSPERDPADWLLEGVTEQDFTEGRRDAWTPLDRRSGVVFSDRHAPLAFQLPKPSPPCRRLRLSISRTADPRVANSVQLACWNLYGTPEKGPDGGGDERLLLRDLRDAVAAAALAPAALSLLGRLLENIRREPKELRFRKVPYW